ncbi:MAG: HYC_CC_PP family protein [Flavobacterium sp.]|jgi:hypothetical protein
MNKVAAFFLAIFLLLINTRLVQNIHLCKGHICSIQTFVDLKKEICCHETEKSCCSINPDHNNCCNDIEFNQDLEDLVLEKSNFDCHFIFTVQNNNSIFYSVQNFCNSIKINAFEIQSNAPPLYQLYHKYIFYA